METQTQPPTKAVSALPSLLQQAYFIEGFSTMQTFAYLNNVNKGWHKPEDPVGVPSSIEVKGNKQMMITGEVAEINEAIRKGNPPSSKIPEFTSEEEELADVVIRCMDYAQKEGCRLAEAIIAKYIFNTTRPHRHGGKLA